MATATAMREWARAQGHDVPVRGPLPKTVVSDYEAAHGSRGPRALPTPDVPDEELEDWISLPDEPPAPSEPVSSGSGRGGEPPQDLPPYEQDPEPGHLAPPPSGRRGRTPQTPARGRTTRVTAAVRNDVQAKIRFVLVPATRMWSMRDPVCGMTAVRQEPEISDALTDIVCDSPDLLTFFTGPGGAYMKYFKLFAAVAPVGMAVYGHHLAHRDDDEQARQQFQAPDYSQYAA